MMGIWYSTLWVSEYAITISIIMVMWFHDYLYNMRFIHIMPISANVNFG